MEDVLIGFLVGSLFSLTEVISHFHDQLWLLKPSTYHRLLGLFEVVC